MRKKFFKILMPFFMSAVLLAGCQAAPEVSKDEEILRAKGSSEDEIEAIVQEDGESGTAGIQEEDGAAESGAQGDSGDGEPVSIVLGSGESRMRIEAEIAAVPEAVSTLTMQADSRLREETLRSFLEPQGEVKDFTEELLAEEEAERQRVAEIDEKLGEGNSMIEIAGVGDGSRLALTDGNRKAVFVGGTGGSYEDAALMEKCYAVAKEEAQKVDVKKENGGDVSFSLQDAKDLLMSRLSVLGIEDIYLIEAYFYEDNGFSVYEVQFCPVVDGMPVAYCFGQEDISKVYPRGVAWVSEEGVAEIGMWNCLMEQVSATEKEKILSFDKVQKLLETYLKDGSLHCVVDVPFSTVELVYFVEQKDNVLELVPMWNIHMEPEEYVEYTGEVGSNDFNWTVYIDAVTGELVAAQ